MNRNKKYTKRHDMRLANKEAKNFLESLKASDSSSEDDLESTLPFEFKRCRRDPDCCIQTQDQDLSLENFRPSTSLGKEDDAISVSDEDELISESSCDNDSIISDSDFDYNVLRLDQEDEFTNNKIGNLSKTLTGWAVKYNIPLNAFTSLLATLNKYTDLNLPNDARTLMKTPRNVQIRQVGGGQYYHFGLKKVLAIICSHYKNAGVKLSTINIIINIDGLPLADSSSACFWPILCSEPILKNVFMIGSFFGYEKPQVSSEFLSEFVEELILIIQEGFTFEDKIYQVQLSCLVCDTPAKSFVLNTKGHTGFSSCTKCTIHGEYLNNRVCFPPKTKVSNGKITIVKEPLKTHESFLSRLDEDYHIGNESILESIPKFDIVADIPLDYMHLVCLGVVKKLIGLWLKGPLTVRIQSRKMNEISQGLEQMKGSIALDFVRRPRPIHTWAQWKATEFRQFLLYSGPIVLANVLNKDIFRHFLTLHVAITVLSNPQLGTNPEFIDYAERLLDTFVLLFGTLYGEQYVSHNVHNLLHLSRDVKKFGPVDEFSAFRFENHMANLKKKIRKSEKPLQQLAKRCGELNSLGYLSNQTPQLLTTNKNPPELMKIHEDGPLPCALQHVHGLEQFKRMNLGMFALKCDNIRDNCCCLNDGTIVFISNFIKFDGEIYIVGKAHTQQKDLYSKPCKSSLLNIYIINFKNTIDYWPISKIAFKMQMFPRKDTFVVIPIIHTFKC